MVQINNFCGEDNSWRGAFNYTPISRLYIYIYLDYLGVDSFSFEFFRTKFENKDKNIKISGLHFLIILLFTTFRLTSNHYQAKLLSKVTRAKL